MSWRRIRVAVALALLALVGLVFVGHWERTRQIRSQAAGIRAVLHLIGPLDNRTLAGFRVLPSFDCLTYRRGSDPLALEICVDRAGRVVQAIDRRGTHRMFWTLQFEPSAAPVRASYAEVAHLVRRMEAT